MRKQSNGWKQLQIKILIDGVEQESIISHVKIVGDKTDQQVGFDIANRIGEIFSPSRRKHAT